MTVVFGAAGDLIGLEGLGRAGHGVSDVLRAILLVHDLGELDGLVGPGGSKYGQRQAIFADFFDCLKLNTQIIRTNYLLFINIISCEKFRINRLSDLQKTK